MLDIELRVTTHRFYSPISFDTRAYAVGSEEPEFGLRTAGPKTQKVQRRIRIRYPRNLNLSYT